MQEHSERSNYAKRIKKGFVGEVMFEITFRKLRSWHLGHHFMANRWGNSDRLLFWGAPKSPQMVTEAMKLKDTYSLAGNL